MSRTLGRMRSQQASTRPPNKRDSKPNSSNPAQVKVTPREQQVLSLLVRGFSNREIGYELRISLRIVKQHLRMLFSRVGIHDGSRRVKLVRCAHEDEGVLMTPCEGLKPTETRFHFSFGKI